MVRVSIEKWAVTDEDGAERNAAAREIPAGEVSGVLDVAGDATSDADSIYGLDIS
jgi:hypothetical protein